MHHRKLVPRWVKTFYGYVEDLYKVAVVLNRDRNRHGFPRNDLNVFLVYFEPYHVRHLRVACGIVSD